MSVVWQLSVKGKDHLRKSAEAHSSDAVTVYYQERETNAVEYFHSQISGENSVGLFLQGVSMVKDAKDSFLAVIKFVWKSRFSFVENKCIKSLSYSTVTWHVCLSALFTCLEDKEITSSCTHLFFFKSTQLKTGGEQIPLRTGGVQECTPSRTNGNELNMNVSPTPKSVVLNGLEEWGKKNPALLKEKISGGSDLGKKLEKQPKKCKGHKWRTSHVKTKNSRLSIVDFFYEWLHDKSYHISTLRYKNKQIKLSTEVCGTLSLHINPKCLQRG